MGVGGGVLLVPAMVFLLGFNQHKAHGTSLAVIIPIVAFGAATYYHHGNIDWIVAGELAVGGVFGAVIGAKLANAISSRRLRKLFGLFLLFMAGRMLYDAAPLILNGQTASAAATSSAGINHAALLVLVTGVAAGALSGLMGIGGGIIMIPAMVYLLDIPQKMAQGISLLVIIPVSLSGAIIHYGKGNVDLRKGGWLAVGGMAGGFLGARLAVQCSDAVLRLIFGLFLLLMAALALRKR